MATFLDISIFSHIRIIFVFLFIAALIYAILLKTKFLGQNKTISVIIAFSVAILFSMMGSTNQMLDLVLPAFAIFLLFGFMIGTLFIFLGGSSDNISSVFGDNPKIMGYWVLIITLLIFLGGFGKIFFDPTSEQAVGINKTVTDGNGNTIEAGSGEAIGQVGENAFWDTIFHPKVLGFIALMMIGTFTVMYMVKS